MQTAAVSLDVMDASRQKRARVRDFPPQATVGEMLSLVQAELGLPNSDAEGRPVAYHAHLDREGRHLNASELVGDALLPEDRITIQPDVNAG